jgi:GNAT superfamily N-acetyltransferase
MSELAIEVLELDQLDAHTMAAARLLVEECADRSQTIEEWHTDNPEHNVEEFLEQYSNPLCSVYALVEPHKNVIAAALVMHELFIGYTQVASVAVYPRARRRGHGTRLMRHVAEQALAHDKAGLLYHTNWGFTEREDEEGFLDRLGFRPTLQEITFEMPAAELLARTQS